MSTAMQKLLSLGVFLLCALPVYAQALPDYLEKQVRSGSLTRQEALIFFKASNTAVSSPPVASSPMSLSTRIQAIQVDTSGAPVRGNSNATLKIIQFCDFQCPDCLASQSRVAEMLQKYGSQAQLTFMNMPLPQHQEAQPAAKAAWAAGRQVKFFEYHDLLFQNQKRLTPMMYPALASQLGLDVNRFNEDRASPEAQTQIDHDLDEADRIGVTGTPTFVINGIKTGEDISPNSVKKILTNPASYAPRN